jgi:sulfite exporter TauE/SafE
MELWTAFMIGLAGSLHCVGMCGPIALALPYQGQQPLQAAGNVLLYNMGRILTYSLLGMVIGLIGKGLFVAGIQAYLSMGLGVLFLIVALFSINLESGIYRLSFIQSLNNWVKKQLGTLLRNHRWYNFFGIGLLNGLLPCGLVYMGIAGAVTSASVLGSMQYMALFGLGTLPLMLATAIGGQFINLKWRQRARRLLPFFLLFFGILFLYRGLNFYIPLEFAFWEDMNNAPMCH